MFYVSFLNKFLMKTDFNQLFCFIRNPLDFNCLAPFGGPVEPGISVGGLPKSNEGICINYFYYWYV